MSSADTNDPAQHEESLTSELPLPKSDRRRHISLAWLLPILAAVIGAYLAYRTLSQRGPEIVILFENAESIEAGRTKIKHKNVDVGDVTSIRLSRDLKKVLVSARMAREIAPYLNQHTRFWIVRARVSAGKVAALGTLVSGAYIAIDPVREGKPVYRFDGLEKPPAVTTGQRGRRFRLVAETLGSVNIGTPVFYRRIEVGEVIDYRLEENGDRLMIDVFIEAPHDRFVHSGARFWHASGVDVSIEATGIQVSTVALAGLLTGGIAFGTPDYLETGVPAQENAVFKLHRDNRAIQEPASEHRIPYLARFPGSVRGLNRNAPVEFRGIQVGRVADVWLEMDRQSGQLAIPVLLEIEPGHFAPVESEREGEALMARLVRGGLRAQLKQVNMLTTQLYVDLDFDVSAKSAEIQRVGRFLTFPTSSATGGDIAVALSEFVDRLGQIDLEAIGRSIQGAAGGARRLLDNPELFRAIGELTQTLRKTQALLGQLEANVAPQVTSLMGRLRSTVESLEGMVDASSPLRVEAREIMLELTRTVRSLRGLADYLQRHPEALLRGKEKD